MTKTIPCGARNSTSICGVWLVQCFLMRLVSKYILAFDMYVVQTAHSAYQSAIKATGVCCASLYEYLTHLERTRRMIQLCVVYKFNINTYLNTCSSRHTPSQAPAHYSSHNWIKLNLLHKHKYEKFWYSCPIRFIRSLYNKLSNCLLDLFLGDWRIADNIMWALTGANCHTYKDIRCGIPLVDVIGREHWNNQH